MDSSVRSARRYAGDTLELVVDEGWAFVVPASSGLFDSAVELEDERRMRLVRLLDPATGITYWTLPRSDAESRVLVHGAVSCGLTPGAATVRFVDSIAARTANDRIVELSEVSDFLAVSMEAGDAVDPVVFAALLMLAIENDVRWDRIAPRRTIPISDSAMLRAIQAMSAPVTGEVVAQDRPEKPYVQIVRNGSVEFAHRASGAGAVIVSAVAWDDARGIGEMVRISQFRKPIATIAAEPIAGLLDRSGPQGIESIAERVVGEAREEALFESSGESVTVAWGLSCPGLADERHVFAVLPGKLLDHDGSPLGVREENESIHRGEPIELSRAGIKAGLERIADEGARLTIALLASLWFGVGYARARTAEP